MGPGVEDAAGRVSQSRLGLLPLSLEFASTTSALCPPPAPERVGASDARQGTAPGENKASPGLGSTWTGPPLEEPLGKGKHFSTKLLLLLKIFIPSFLFLVSILASSDLPKIAPLQSRVFRCEGGKAEGESRARLPGSSGRLEGVAVEGAQVSFFCTVGGRGSHGAWCW